jgi:poly-gamma-glutamate capsule biosynthesis protein CapA/YwtB (metallophosphatase superfamily)
VTDPDSTPKAGGDLFRVALTGDACITRRLSPYAGPEFLHVVELLRGVDIALTNLEMLFHDYESPPMPDAHGGHFRSDPALAHELAWMGFRMVSLANNHCGDFGFGGLRSTLSAVRAAGLVPAGAGESLAEAREAKFCDTARARVALVAAASTFPDHARAGPGGGGILSRPGLSALRSTSRLVLPRPALEGLRKMLRGAGMNVAETGDVLSITFCPPITVGEPPGIQTQLLEKDLEEVAAVVAGTTRQADYTIASLHAHEGPDTFTPAHFLVDATHTLIDAGADAVMGHGPHVLRGVEIYRGKPIFYSLGAIIYQTDSILRYPEETFELFGLDRSAGMAGLLAARERAAPFVRWPEAWESVIPVLAFRGRDLAGIDLHPVSLGFERPSTLRGRPVLPAPEHAAKILEDLVRLSKPFGTRIELQDGIGTIQLSPAS